MPKVNLILETPERLTEAGLPRKPGKRGGARPGAGRPKKTPEDATVRIDEDMTMLDFLREVALGRIVPSAIQVQAARTAVQYESVKTGDGGKKEARQAAAEEGAGALPTTPAPVGLRSVG